MKSLSIVIPVFNEEENVAELHKEIKQLCENEGYTYEIIFVDDGSRDRTVKKIKSLHPVRLIQMRKNFGQTAAMDAGIHAAQYPFIVTMDGDGQNDPADIPRLFEHLDEYDLDIVSGWRKKRKDSFIKHFVSRGANVLRKLLIHDGIHDSGCSLKVYKKECFENLFLYGEMHRFIPALLKIRGFRVGEIVVNHRPRTKGKTKYNWRRTIKGFIDMISVWFWNKYNVRPLHLLGGMGLFFFILGTFSGFGTLFYYIMGQSLSDTVLPLLTVFFMLFGIQLFISGLMADTLIKSYYEVRNTAYYSIRDEFISEKEKELIHTK